MELSNLYLPVGVGGLRNGTFCGDERRFVSDSCALDLLCVIGAAFRWSVMGVFQNTCF